MGTTLLQSRRLFVAAYNKNRETQLPKLALMLKLFFHARNAPSLLVFAESAPQITKAVVPKALPPLLPRLVGFQASS